MTGELPGVAAPRWLASVEHAVSLDTLPPDAERAPDVTRLFAPVSAELGTARALLRRTDAKFALRACALEALLAPLAADYGALYAAGAAVATYRTLYFDTPGLRCFHDHRRGRFPRYKVRVRHHLERELSFLEIKARRAGDVSVKHRRQRGYGDHQLTPADRVLVAAHSDLDADALVPQVWTVFRRLTLVAWREAERVTIDTALELSRGGRCEALEGAAIVEVKQARASSRSPMMLALRRAGVRPVSVSKYCAATVLLRGVRANRLLPGLRALVPRHREDD